MKLDRLLGIVTVLLQNQLVTAPYLAGKFEVSRRTIGRDIDALCQAGIPVITRQGGGGGISIAEGFKLDKSVLTAEELAEMMAALRGLGSVSDASQMEKTLAKLAPNQSAVVSLRESIVIDLASYHKGSLTEKIELIKQAIRQQRLIAFDYYYEKGIARRVIEPAFVVFHWTAWSVFGFCTLRRDFRLFKLQRLWGLELCQETFLPRDIPPEKRDFDSHLPDHRKLVALFDPSVRYQLIETYGLHCYTETQDGLLRLEIGYTNQEYTLSWLLGFGGKVRVLEPREMAEALRSAAQKILEANP